VPRTHKEASVKKSILVFAALACFAGSALAQDPPGGPAKKARLGAGIYLGLPVGDMGDLVDLSLGVLADFDFILTPAISVTGRAGYVHHLEDIDNFSFYTIPFWAGIKYYFMPEGVSARFFAAPELAFNFNGVSAEFNGFEGSDSELDIGLNLGGGVELGPISIRVFLAIFDLGEAGDSLQLAASAAYYFVAF
jgi:hypothetical protein